MGLILFGIGFVAVFAFALLKSNRRDPRYAGQNLMTRGLLIFGIGWLALVSGMEIKIKWLSVSITYVGYSVAIIGFCIAVFGWFKHAKLMTTRSTDTWRMVDPDYDVPYTECPHCHKVQVRVTGRTAKCPECGGKIKPESK